MDALCSKKINKEKLELPSEYWVFFGIWQSLVLS